MIIWKQAEGIWAQGESGFVGKWICFSISWRSMSRNTPETEPRHTLRVMLPGLASPQGHFHTPEAAKERAERVLAYWIKEAKIVEPQL